MKYTDMHCDTLLCSLKNGGDLYDIPTASVDLKRLKGTSCVQFFAIFLPPEDDAGFWSGAPVNTDEELISRLVSNLKAATEDHADIVAPVLCASDIEKNIKSGKVSALLSMEDARAFDSNLANIKRFYDIGFRAAALTWNGINCLGYPNSDDPLIMSAGLTDFGKEAVAYMQQLGMLVDVSHLSDGGFYDVAEVCKKPFIASHSNCRAISPHRRNLTDDMIKILSDKGGVAGLNFCAAFLSADTTSDDSLISDMTANLKHLTNVGGISVAALGTDFDGIGGKLEIDSCDKMDMLYDALKKSGFTQSEADDIFFNNAMRVLKETL